MNVELFKQAIAYIETVPDARVDLSDIAENPLDCNTLACAAGHLALNPAFQAHGLKVTLDGVLKFLNSTMSYDRAMAALFNISSDEAFELFCPRTRRESILFSRYDATLDANWSDKRVWLHRAHAFLKERGHEG